MRARERGREARMDGWSVGVCGAAGYVVGGYGY